MQPPILDAVRHGDGRRRFTPLDLVELAAAECTADVAARDRPAPTPTPASCWPVSSSKRSPAEPLHQAYRDLVLDPAGMVDTWLESSDAAPRRPEIASHDFEGQDITDMDPTVDWAGGGLVSTAADLAAFLRALTAGRLLSTGAWNEMTDGNPARRATTTTTASDWVVTTSRRPTSTGRTSDDPSPAVVLRSWNVTRYGCAIAAVLWWFSP